jgi:hypothetical protein
MICKCHHAYYGKETHENGQHDANFPLPVSRQNGKPINFDRHWFYEAGRQVPINSEGVVPFKEHSHITQNPFMTFCSN